MRTLEPGKILEFKVVSQRMVKPGTYQLVYSLAAGNSLYSQSEFSQIAINKAKDKEQEHEALKKWLYFAAASQCVEIAQDLLRFNDNSGTKEVIRLLEENEYTKDHFIYDPAFRFVWQNGKKEGESVMLALIKRQTKQEYAQRMIESTYLSSNHISLLEDLLDCTVFMNNSSNKPRICDITAAWLMGYTQGKLKFPKEGSLEEKDMAVAYVRDILKKNPTFFTILSKDYR